MNPINLLRSFFTVGFWTLASRILGFVREALLANFFGAGAFMDAWSIAFALPNMFRRFFAEGAFNMAFVPLFAKKLEGKEDAEGFASDALSVLGTVVILLTVIAQIAMPAFVLLMASGFLGDERLDLSVMMGRIVFPYIIFISLSALFSGVLNSLGRFAAAAAAPVLLNIIIIIAMLSANHFGYDVGQGLIWSVPLAGIAQLILVWYATTKAGLKIFPRMPKITPDLKRLALIAAPAALAGGVVQVNLLVGRQVASYFEGANSWLYYADRLYQLPLGVVGIAIGVVLLPDLSRRLRSDDLEGSKHSFNRATEFTMALSLPATIALVVVPLPLIQALFERGAFLPSDSLATAYATAVYALGLPAFVLQKVLQPLYFAREDTKTPVYYAVIAMITNAVLAIGLSPFLTYLAPAIATSLSAWVMVFLLWRGSQSMGEAAQFDSRTKTRLPRILAASLVMGAVLWVYMQITSPLMQTGWKYFVVLGLIFLGMFAYFGCAQMFKAIMLRELKSGLRR